jgi:hypothetical protein
LVFNNLRQKLITIVYVGAAETQALHTKALQTGYNTQATHTL